MRLIVCQQISVSVDEVQVVQLYFTMKGILVFLLVISTALSLDYPRECPSAAEEDPWHPVHLPHPTDCNKFYKCSQGEKHEQVCPASLHWNIEKDYCDYPTEAKCERPLPPY